MFEPGKGTISLSLLVQALAWVQFPSRSLAWQALGIYIQGRVRWGMGPPFLEKRNADLVQKR